MKVLMINGSPRVYGNTYIALHEMEKVFTDSEIETEILHVGNKDIRGCIACASCAKTGKCVFNDIVNETAKKFEECNGLVVGSPVYYGQHRTTHQVRNEQKKNDPQNSRSHRNTLYFESQGALDQTDRENLSARYRFANANMIFSLAVCFFKPR